MLRIIALDKQDEAQKPYIGSICMRVGRKFPRNAREAFDIYARRRLVVPVVAT